jgi:hypothetical protein
MEVVFSMSEQREHKKTGSLAGFRKEAGKN